MIALSMLSWYCVELMESLVWEARLFFLINQETYCYFINLKKKLLVTRSSNPGRARQVTKTYRDAPQLHLQIFAPGRDRTPDP